MKKKPTYVYTYREVSLAIQLAGFLDPDNFPDLEVKSVILKSKAMEFPCTIKGVS